MGRLPASGLFLTQPLGDHHDVRCQFLDENGDDVFVNIFIDDDVSLDCQAAQGGVWSPPRWRGAGALCQVLARWESSRSWVKGQRHLYLPGDLVSSESPSLLNHHDHDNQVKENYRKYNRLGRCLGHSSHVIQLDWTTDCQHIRSNSADHEVQTSL